jgi:hypothetical protein
LPNRLFFRKSFQVFENIKFVQDLSGGVATQKGRIATFWQRQSGGLDTFFCEMVNLGKQKKTFQIQILDIHRKNLKQNKMA